MRNWLFSKTRKGFLRLLVGRPAPQASAGAGKCGRMRVFFLLFFCISLRPGAAQNQSPVTAKTSTFIIVRDIVVLGNKRTRRDVLLRELDFGVGDTLDLIQLPARFERNRKWLYDKDLFASVQFNIGNWDFETHQAVITLTVRESWYILPLPTADLADRNFNVWWRDHNRSWKRINVGLSVYHLNLTGRMDRLTVTGQLGFTQKAEIEYRRPFFDRRKRWGFTGRLSFKRERAVGYRVEDFKERFFFNEEDYSLRRMEVRTEWIYRPDVRTTQTLAAGLHANRIVAFVRDSLNPMFLSGGGRRELFPSFGYTYRHDGRDVNLYPVRGRLWQVGLSYDGALSGRGPDKWQADVAVEQYIELTNRWSVALAGKLVGTIAYGHPSYYHQNSLGGESDYIRGYEYYVLNGQDFGYIKSSVRFRLFDWQIAVPFGRLVSETGKVRFRLFLAANNDVGIIRERFAVVQNPLSNVWLHGHGLGLDFVWLQGRAVRLEYSRNHLGETGFYLHIKLFN